MFFKAFVRKFMKEKRLKMLDHKSVTLYIFIFYHRLVYNFGEKAFYFWCLIPFLLSTPRSWIVYISQCFSISNFVQHLNGDS